MLVGLSIENEEKSPKRDRIKKLLYTRFINYDSQYSINNKAKIMPLGKCNQIQKQ